VQRDCSLFRDDKSSSSFGKSLKLSMQMCSREKLSPINFHSERRNGKKKVNLTKFLEKGLKEGSLIFQFTSFSECHDVRHKIEPNRFRIACSLKQQSKIESKFIGMQKFPMKTSCVITLIAIGTLLPGHSSRMHPETLLFQMNFLAGTSFLLILLLFAAGSQHVFVAFINNLSIRNLHNLLTRNGSNIHDSPGMLTNDFMKLQADLHVHDVMTLLFQAD